MLGKRTALDVLDSSVTTSPAEQTEIRFWGQSSYLTRYSDNYIHQNVGEANLELHVRAVNAGRIGSASTNQTDGDSLREVVREAHGLSLLSPVTPDFKSLPVPEEIKEPLGGYFESTACCPPDLRAAYVDRVIEMAKHKGVKVAGSLSTDTIELAVANTLGVRAYTVQTRASLTCVAMGADSSGHAAEYAGDIASIDPTRVAERAIGKCLASRDPIGIGPGEYDVILEPEAVASMLMYLAFLGLSGEAYQEGRSFMSGRLGQKIMGEAVSIWDDGLDPSGFPMPFDFEGVPKRKVVLIDHGVATGVVYGSLCASREGKRSTGHAVSQMGFTGSFPTNLFMAPGQSSLEQMIASTKRGILVSRFHYVNPVHPIKAIITGTTRDGTFLVEDGKVVRGIRNLRFTESILGAFSRVEDVSAERETIGGLLTIVCPAIKVRGFNFTGTTEF